MTDEIVTDEKWKEFKKALGNMTDKEIEKKYKNNRRSKLFKRVKKGTWKTVIKERAYKEATRNPIFLFQERRVTLKAEYGFAEITWDTTGVWLTREEGEDFGEKTHYRYGSKGKNIDWRVYCIALERDSELANMLNEKVTIHI